MTIEIHLKKVDLLSGQWGSLYYNNGTLTINDYVVSGNTVVQGINTFVRGGGINSEIGTTLTIINSTISGNSIQNRDDKYGGGICSRGTLTLINSTVSGNSLLSPFSEQPLGGGIYFEGIATIINSTITKNSNSGTVSNGGGIFNEISNMRIINTIVSGNTSSGSPNIFGSTSINLNNFVGGDARFAPLGNYGGTTLTHALLSDSSAINMGNNCVLTANGCGSNNPALLTDQRGNQRLIGETVDIGAVESNITFDQTTLPNGNTNLESV